MSDAFAELERELCRGVRRLAATKPQMAKGSSAWRAPRDHTVRLVALAIGLVLAMTTIALAATGVILTGSPVRPSGPVSPRAGEGVPVPGHTRLLSLRAADPQGGLPWGMRVVSTTRGLVCLQVGRVKGHELGELGIDGAFHDDGRFHSLPADVLPIDARSGLNANTSCHLAGESFAGELWGIDRNASASEIAPPKNMPREQLRNVSYGALGEQAVSVTYREGASEHDEPVLSGIGAYLIVGKSVAGEQVGSSGGATGMNGERVNPDGALTAIAYRVRGGVCEQSMVLHVADPCPRTTQKLPSLTPTKNLHVPIHVSLSTHTDKTVDAEISFKAPYAVSSARQDYVFAMPVGSCHGMGIVEDSLARDVKATETVSHDSKDVFANACGKQAVRLSVLYRSGEGMGEVLVGQVTITNPKIGAST